MPIIVLVKYDVQPGKHDRAIHEIASLVNTVTATEQGTYGCT